MIDLHCHILPGLDDGAQTLEEALSMARIAVSDGITDIVATPHTRDGIYRNDAASVLKEVEAFQQALDTAEIPLRIHPGAEVHIHTDFVENIIASQVLTMGDRRKHVLLEFPILTIPRFAGDLMYELKIAGITPIIAHPERNSVLREDLDLLKDWVEQGAVAQVTAGSLTGHLGKRTQLAAEAMVKQRLVHVVASDGHNSSRRRPELQAAYRMLSVLTSVEEANAFNRNAKAILDGELCEVWEPIAMPRKKRFFFF